MPNIIINDLDKKTYQIYLFLEDKKEELITNNIADYLQKYPDRKVNMHIISSRADIVDSHINWTENQGLYDGLIIEYNNDPNRTKLLDFWC
jgi:hypothetical protein